MGAYIYTIEQTKGDNRGFWGAACKATGNLGTTIGLGLVALLRAVLTWEQMLLFGWRIPFFLGKSMSKNNSEMTVTIIMT